MALYPINPSETDAVLTELFFYVKGSHDYPSTQLITKQFGFDPNDKTQENPIFNTTILDLQKKLHRPRIVDNLYSLISDTTHGILPISSTSTDKNMRNDHSQEYISSMIINNGDPSESVSTNKYSDHIDPNYELNANVAIGNFNSVDTVNNITNYEHVFWQKMYTLLEFIKKNEEKIIEDHRTNELPSWINTENSTTWWSNANYTSLQAELKKETVIGRYIALFIGNSVKFSTNQEKFNDRVNVTISNGVVSSVPFNPIRSESISGTIHGPTTNIEKYEEYIWQKENLDLQYIPLSASFSISEAGSSSSPRIGSFEFQVKYKFNTSSYQNVLLRVYFSPDDMVSSSVYNALKVYTYNDINLDGKYPANANIYDNDYSNLLSKDANIKNNFIVNNTELNDNMIKAIADIYKSGDYTNHIIYSTRRVTPTISDAGTEIRWLDDNSTNQNFFIFYNGNEPTIAEQMAAVQDYLKNLHNDCSPTTYDENGKITLIGHTESEKIEFLSKMYPSLFTSVNIHIIPLGTNMYRNLSDSYPTGGSYDPEKYFHTLTPERMYNTMRSYTQFKNFKLNEAGNVVLTEQSASQVYLPLEVLYTGGLNNIPGVDNGNVIKFDFPWIATCRGEQTTLPLTSRSGFADYRQKWFTSNSTPSTAADKLQYILLVLSLDMFTENKTDMHRRKTIGGINIEYNENVNDEVASGYENEVSFSISGIKFTVHSQIGKNFGASSNPNDKEDL